VEGRDIYRHLYIQQEFSIDWLVDELFIV
jgi:hypothetical protein